MTWSAQIHGVENLAPEMEGALHAGIQLGLERIGIKGAAMVEENIRTPFAGKPPAVAFGHLAASITSNFYREASLVKEIIGVNPAVGAYLYAPPVETGTRPHMPPPSALLPWVIKKFGDMDEKSAMSIAFAVATKIRQRGTQGHFMFERADEALGPIAPEILEAALAEAFREQGFTGGDK